MSSSYFNLSGKVALVTGASSGLGIHFANLLAAEGALVILTARREHKLACVVEGIQQAGGVAMAIPMDVTSVDSVTTAFARIRQEHGRLDILINNAGVASNPTKFLDTGEEDWAWVMQTNLDGAWRAAKAAAQLMVDVGEGGTIVNIASIYGLHTGALKVAYNVSKAGVVQMTKSMAVEMCRHNIRVNALCPGWVMTDLNREYFLSEGGKRYVKTIPMKRLGQVDDLTVPLLMLASDKAGSYMTGTCVTVDGGIVESAV
ncbi:SDR family NAD(P)-dependent oxidoreductase [Halioxenophilus aromaticivorans]|uniref:SDR family oxidoreductase n=1 Tax=Halioxenophilus aromaticivorans TaxID=1306992 RepID=A0AAV3TX99_9ALTE